MPKLKREMFLRPTRFTHRFGATDDPFSQSEYFDLKGPTLPKSGNKSSPGTDIHKQGLHVYTQPYSGVDKFSGGKASINGPRLDTPDMLAEPVPVSTKKRGPKGVI